MNILQRKQIIIDYWIWEPMSKQIKEDEDRLLALKHENKLLPHCGYIKMTFLEGEIVDPNKTKV